MHGKPCLFIPQASSHARQKSKKTGFVTPEGVTYNGSCAAGRGTHSVGDLPGPCGVCWDAQEGDQPGVLRKQCDLASGGRKLVCPAEECQGIVG